MISGVLGGMNECEIRYLTQIATCEQVGSISEGLLMFIGQQQYFFVRRKEPHFSLVAQPSDPLTVHLHRPAKGHAKSGETSLQD